MVKITTKIQEHYSLYYLKKRTLKIKIIIKSYQFQFDLHGDNVEPMDMQLIRYIYATADIHTIHSLSKGGAPIIIN